MNFKNNFFPNKSQPPTKKITVKEVADEIRVGVYKAMVDTIRNMRAQGYNESANKLKATLPAFTPSGLFSGGHGKHQLTEYVPLMVLDLDNIDMERLDDVKQKARNCTYTLACFISPSGNGLKILLKTNATGEQHEACFKQVADYFERVLGEKVDRTGKDVTRLCFMSYDQDIYHNEQSQVWDYQMDPMAEATAGEVADWEGLFQAQVNFTNNIKAFEDSNRNNYVYQLACNLNRMGMPFDEALSRTQRDFTRPDFGQDEIRTTVHSAYQNISEFDQMANMANMANMASTNFENESETPTFPSSVYENLPGLLKDITGHFDNAREKDMILLSSLGVLSGVFSTVRGTYDSKWVYANLYLLVSAPAASGKGVMSYAKKLVDRIHDEWKNTSQDAISAHLEQYRNTKNPPPPPPLRLLLHSGDTTLPSLMDNLNACDGVGIMFSSEADMVSSQWRKEHGNYSTFLRQNFHHEGVSYSRKTNQQHVEIESPKLSLVSSGTLEQVSRLISSSEDGLFSRFMHYTFESASEWKDVFEKVNFEDSFNSYADRVYGLHKRYDDLPAVTFALTKDQQAILNKEMDGLHKQAVSDGDTPDIVLRLGLIWFRIAMLLTCIRQENQDDIPSQLICRDEDFEICRSLIPLLFEHSQQVSSRFPQNQSQHHQGHMRLLAKIPLEGEYKRKDILQMSGIKSRTLNDYLRKLVQEGHLVNLGGGVYTRSSKK